jgi:DNA modification methylase
VKIRDRIRELRRVPASELRPNPKNWRTHPQAQADALKGVLAEVGIADAVLARELEDGSLMLLDGHLRVETMGDQVLPVLVLDVDEAEGDKVLATLDPLAAMAESDAAKLDAILREVNTGSPELQQMLADLAEDAGLYKGDEAKEVVEDEIPEPPVDPITKPGDLWVLGDHRLLCGDSTKAEDVGRLMAGAKADLCFTSPPYGQQRDYTEEGKAKVADWDGLMRGVFGNLPMADAGQVLVNLGLIHRDGEWLPYWDAWIEWMREQGWKRFGWYVWDKKHPMPMKDGGRLLPQHEFVFHFNLLVCDCNKSVPSKTAGAKHDCGAKNKRGEQGDTGRFETGSHRVQGSVISIAPEDGRMAGNPHPAQFPVAFPSAFVPIWTSQGGTIYEPFCGSGTTLIAAEQLGRKCYGMEISPQYCDVIVKRWETLTGKKAERETASKRKAK